VAVLDVTGDGGLDVSDVVSLAMFLFNGGAPPARGLECFWVPPELGCTGNVGCQ
jgi:hypothetical protein